ncbi:MAG: hypothetical protein QOE54_3047 [Streptosporangiaceae bacterium]|jgi:hypothetical protein|nr:hypothetical protein [Streptosporangiaceae bacterium]MDX6430681.1 hypothetical protein [Streptosporangiaceae bacterium]
MWLNVFIMGFASLSVGFILGWVMGRPRRWDRYVWNEAPTVPGPATDDLVPLSTTLTTHG